MNVYNPRNPNGTSINGTGTAVTAVTAVRNYNIWPPGLTSLLIFSVRQTVYRR